MQTTFYWRKDKMPYTERSTKLDREIMLKKEEKEQDLEAKFNIDSFSLNQKVMKDMSWKEEQNAKLQDRQHIIQTSVNPFLTNDYLKDLDAQKEFLTPKDSNIKE